MKIDKVMRMAPVIPVLVVKDAAHALPMAQALVKGGLPVLEVTLRTEAALDVIREMSKVEGSFVGAGTVLNEKQLDSAIDAGAKFIVSPGLTKPLAKAAIERGIPFLPGIATAADIMRGLDLGLDHFRLNLFAQKHPAFIQNLRDMRTQLARLRINYLEFFLDA